MNKGALPPWIPYGMQCGVNWMALNTVHTFTTPHWNRYSIVNAPQNVRMQMYYLLTYS